MSVPYRPITSSGSYPSTRLVDGLLQRIRPDASMNCTTSDACSTTADRNRSSSRSRSSTATASTGSTGPRVQRAHVVPETIVGCVDAPTESAIAPGHVLRELDQDLRCSPCERPATDRGDRVSCQPVDRRFDLAHRAGTHEHVLDRADIVAVEMR